MPLEWPRENAIDPSFPDNRWFHPGSNYCLDFHGDPARSDVYVFSDGNHHMALEQTLAQFRRIHRLRSIFYCTTPPKVYLDWIEAGLIEIGNLQLSVTPDVIISPDDIMERLAKQNRVSQTKIFASSNGISLLVRKGNPKSILDAEDVVKRDVRMFISNPITESASHTVYADAMKARLAELNKDPSEFDQLLNAKESVEFGALIHHREAPQAIAGGKADVAIVYNHLALRYARIFPEIFDTIQLPGAGQKIITRYAIGLTESSSEIASSLFEFFSGRDAADAYTYHGLSHIAQ